jgi:2,3-diaminopropionate biosynthesis protein SbnB
MNTNAATWEFSVVSGETVNEILSRSLAQAIDVVQKTYLSHKQKKTVNPDSYFLKFPDQPKDRIIALPAAIKEDSLELAGIKWIASFPENIQNGMPRATALLILNSLANGSPYACVEASAISSVRTAASAVLGAYWLNHNQRKTKSISFVGSGIIAKTIYELFEADSWTADEINIYDLNPKYAYAFQASMGAQVTKHCRVVDTLEEALTSDIVVLATTAAEPYIKPPISFKPNQIVLNISLRDIHPDLVLDAWNIVDDVDHCLKASTSLHLTEQVVGNRDFVAGTLAELISGEIEIDDARPKIYSPFGMGILDLALGEAIYQKASEEGKTIKIPNFFAHSKRW